MKHCTVISKIPRSSRYLQYEILKAIESRFQCVINTPFLEASPKQMKCQIQLIKMLLIDIRHIMMYQSLDHDIHERFLKRAEHITTYLTVVLDHVLCHQMLKTKKAA